MKRKNGFKNMFPDHFLPSADEYLYSVTGMHMQVRLMGHLDLNGSICWLKGNGRAICLFGKRISEVWITFHLIVSSLKRILSPFGATCNSESSDQSKG